MLALLWNASFFDRSATAGVLLIFFFERSSPVSGRVAILIQPVKRAPRFALSSTSPTLSLFFFSDSVAVHRTGLDLPLPAAMFSCWTKPKSAGASLNFVFSRRQNRPTKPKQGSAADLHRRLNESIGACGCSASLSSTNSELLLEAPREPADKALRDSAADSHRRRQLSLQSGRLISSKSNA